MCHRDLALENVLLYGGDSKRCCIVGLGNALRIPCSVRKDCDNDDPLTSTTMAGTDATGNGVVYHYAMAQPNYVRRLQYAPPEVLQNLSFDVRGVDLWAAAIMLLSMLFGTDAPFVGPVEEDRKFRNICIRGNLQYYVEQWEQDSDLPTPVSSLALDLLQSMLRANPNDRPTLEEIQQHPWMLMLP